MGQSNNPIEKYMVEWKFIEDFSWDDHIYCPWYDKVKKEISDIISNIMHGDNNAIPSTFEYWKPREWKIS